MCHSRNHLRIKAFQVADHLMNNFSFEACLYVKPSKSDAVILINYLLLDKKLF